MQSNQRCESLTCSCHSRGSLQILTARIDDDGAVAGDIHVGLIESSEIWQRTVWTEGDNRLDRCTLVGAQSVTGKIDVSDRRHLRHSITAVIL